MTPGGPWYTDPRWWAIGVSFLLGAANLFWNFWQSANPKKERLADAAAKTFDESIGRPIDEVLGNLRRTKRRIDGLADNIAAVDRQRLASSLRNGDFSSTISTMRNYVMEVFGYYPDLEGLIREAGRNIELTFSNYLDELEKDQPRTKDINVLRPGARPALPL